MTRAAAVPAVFVAALCWATSAYAQEPARAPQPTQAAPRPVDTDTARRLLLGRWQGGNRCGKAVALEFKFDTAEARGRALVLRGEARSVEVAGQPKPPAIVAVVNGTLDLDSGLLAINASGQPMEPFCPGIKMGSKCIGQFNDSFNIQERRRQTYLREQAEHLARSAFLAEAVRGDDGDTLAGTVRGASFDCEQFSLRRADTAALRELPGTGPVVALQAAQRVQDTGKPGSDGAARLHWLKTAAALGEAQAAATLGRVYEVGTETPKDMALSVRYYEQAAQAGEARAQQRLAELYASGDGVPQDRTRSADLARRAGATKAAAGRVCVAPEMIDAYLQLLESLRRDPAMLMLQLFGTALTGLSFNDGSFQIQGAAAEGVSFIDRPYTCRVVGRRVGASARNVRPSFDYAGEDSLGRPLFYDRSGDVAMNEFVASLATSMASKVQANQPYRIEALGGRRYRVTLVPQLIATGTAHVLDVELALDRP